jgi:phytoene synthase
MQLFNHAATYCRKLTTRSQSNFYYAFLFLPPERRQALEAVYAYCRLVDDVVDGDAPVSEKLSGLDIWRREVQAIFDAHLVPTHPVSQKLREAVARFAITRGAMEGIIDGCAMDVSMNRYATWDELRTYCYRVASCVGLMCVEIFGYREGAADAVRKYAVDLGIALQLTNILRDVAEDSARGRIYLPAEDLQAFGVSEAELQAGHRSPAFLRLMQFEAARARAHYLRARAALSAADRRQLVVAEIMGDIYYALLCRLEATQFDIFSGKLAVPRRQKMAIALGKFDASRIPSRAFTD